MLFDGILQRFIEILYDAEYFCNVVFADKITLLLVYRLYPDCFFGNK